VCPSPVACRLSRGGGWRMAFEPRSRAGGTLSLYVSRVRSWLRCGLVVAAVAAVVAVAVDGWVPCRTDGDVRVWPDPGANNLEALEDAVKISLA
jgi:hypothetical protein